MIRIYHVGKVLHPRHVFRISRASRPQVDNVFLVLEQDGVLGYGEASPNSFFKEDFFDVNMRLAGLHDYFRRQTLSGPGDIGRIWNEIWERVAPSRATQCAVDVALWDLHSKLAGESATESATGAAAHAVPTSATLGICPREEWPERIGEVAGFPAVKVKLDAQVDMDLLQAIRARTPAAIRVDANGAWGGLDIADISARLEALGVEFIEQPLPPGEDARMEAILRVSRLPIFADESCAGPDDVARLPGRFSGFNIKLVKCGGITPALAMLREGKRLGLKVMVGCMLESSLLIAAGAVVAQGADYADLDGSWLLRDDPFRGLKMVQGRIEPNFAPGLGVNPEPPRD
ncbi:MAG: Mandelate racemase/muconate lactonizing protein [Fibrobacteres bacterium]|nr:Mandelate racemase/muconate lactonizing protein [Fibrobacterota bacterium]